MATKLDPGKYNCLARAKEDEPYFMLLGRDATAPLVVLAWCVLRTRMGLNDPEQLQEARDCAVAMQAYAMRLGKRDLINRARQKACQVLIDLASGLITDSLNMHVEEALDGTYTGDTLPPPPPSNAASGGGNGGTAAIL